MVEHLQGIRHSLHPVGENRGWRRANDTWRQWSWRWNATAGKHTLRVRAADPAGEQTGRRAPVEPDGATGWHEVSVDVAE